MCVICIKPAGVALPDTLTRGAMWLTNPDGAGIMYAYKGKVWIEKGFMRFNAMEDRLDELSSRIDLEAVPMVLHYRITTHGGTNPQNTHPFPVCARARNLHALRTCADLGVAHNGIINSVKPRAGFSDTAEYTAQRLAHLPRTFTQDADTLTLIASEIGWSRLAFLDGHGRITRVGDGWTEECGCWYSNTHWHIFPAHMSARKPAHTNPYTYTPAYTNAYTYYEDGFLDDNDLPF